MKRSNRIQMAVEVYESLRRNNIKDDVVRRCRIVFIKQFCNAVESLFTAENAAKKASTAWVLCLAKCEVQSRESAVFNAAGRLATSLGNSGGLDSLKNLGERI